MREFPFTSSPAARRLGAVLIATAVAASLAACGSSPATQAPSVTQPPASIDPGGAGGAGGGGAASLVAGGGGTADCTATMAAATDVSLEMQALYQVDSAARWKALADPSAPMHLDAARFAAAVAAIGGLPGGADVAAKYRPIVDLETQAFAASDPWGDGSGPAAKAHDTAAAGFIDMGVALTQLLEALACAP